MGDHERMLLDALDGDRAAATDWLWAGGKLALASWGLDPELPRPMRGKPRCRPPTSPGCAA